MKKIFWVAIALIVSMGTSMQAKVREAGDTVTAKEAFVRLPAGTLDLLTTSMRLDLLEYLQQDSIYQVPNALEGLSYFNPPVTDDFLQIQVTPVTKLTIRMLPGKKGPVVATSYTVGDSLQAFDSDLKFFDADMVPIKLEKIIKIASSEDFLELHGLSHEDRDRILYCIPFPTVEYSFSPDGTDLHAHLTVEDFLTKEDAKKIEPYLRRDRIYHWDGKKYHLVPLDR